jgi:hypothetical protein
MAGTNTSGFWAAIGATAVVALGVGAAVGGNLGAGAAASTYEPRVAAADAAAVAAEAQAQEITAESDRVAAANQQTLDEQQQTLAETTAERDDFERNLLLALDERDAAIADADRGWALYDETYDLGVYADDLRIASELKYIALAREYNETVDERNEYNRIAFVLDQENDALVNQYNWLVDAANSAIDELYAENDELAAQNAALVAERDAALAARDAAILGADDVLRAENTALRAEIDTVAAARDQAIRERDAAVGERDAYAGRLQACGGDFQAVLAAANALNDALVLLNAGDAAGSDAAIQNAIAALNRVTGAC